MSDDSMGANPEVATALTQQMVGGLETAHYGFPLYSRLRYFAPERQPGIPANVAALVDSMSATEVAVTLVNLDQTEARTVVVQAGAYGEHRFAAAGSARATVDRPYVRVRLEPGCAERIVFGAGPLRQAADLHVPWDRAE